MTKVRIAPAMGRMTLSDSVLIIPKTLLLHAWGVVPTVPAISATCPLMLSNSPFRLLMIPAMSIFLIHSIIWFQRKFIRICLLAERPPPKRGLGSSGNGKQVGEQGNQHHADQHDTRSGHKLYHSELVVKMFAKIDYEYLSHEQCCNQPRF